MSTLSWDKIFRKDVSKIFPSPNVDPSARCGPDGEEQFLISSFGTGLLTLIDS